jgi:hypothetical protein
MGPSFHLETQEIKQGLCNEQSINPDPENPVPAE